MTLLHAETRSWAWAYVEAVDAYPRYTSNMNVFFFKKKNLNVFMNYLSLSMYMQT